MDDKRVEAAAREIWDSVVWDAYTDRQQSARGRIVERALAASDAAAWMPIETAPHGVALKLAWKDKYGEWKYAFDKASWDWKLGDYRSGVSHHSRATHWQPLPAPPSDATP